MPALSASGTSKKSGHSNIPPDLGYGHGMDKGVQGRVSGVRYIGAQLIGTHARVFLAGVPFLKAGSHDYMSLILTKCKPTIRVVGKTLLKLST